MEHQEHHEMQIAQTHTSGAEEWYCPTCGRRFLMKWPPAYSKIVLEPGDEYAIHSGGKGGLAMGLPESDAFPQPLETDPLLLETIEGDGVAMDFLADPTPAADENLTIELSDELLAPWRTYIEGQQEN